MSRRRSSIYPQADSLAEAPGRPNAQVVETPFSSDDEELLTALTDGQVIADAEAAELETWAGESYARFRRELLAGALRESDVSERLGLPPEAVVSRVADGALVAVREGETLLFPPWQFDPGETDGVVRGLSEVLRALDLDPLSKIGWLTRSSPHDGGRTPLDALRDGEKDRVVRLAWSAGMS